MIHRGLSCFLRQPQWNASKHPARDGETGLWHGLLGLVAATVATVAIERRSFPLLEQFLPSASARGREIANHRLTG
jgi:hypothetical protein